MTTIICAIVAAVCFARALIATRAAEITGEAIRYQARTISALRGRLELAEAENHRLRRGSSL